MKHQLSFGATILLLVCLISQNSYAQIEVETTGNVKVGKQMSIATERDNYTLLNIAYSSHDTQPWYGIKTHLMTKNSMPTGPLYGIYSFADASLSNGFPINPIVGICGKAYTTSYNCNTFSAGVVGLANYYCGIGVYGAIDSSTDLSLPSVSYGTSYAGYFSGGVKVTATLTAASVSTTSDARLKDDIQSLGDSAIQTINELRPVTFKFKQDSTQFVYEDGAQEMQVQHYGLVAQEVQMLLPNIVYEGGDGYLSVNYTELIPLLIKSVQELSAEVEELRAIVNAK